MIMESMYLVRCHSNVLEDEGAVEEEEVVGGGGEGGAQSCAECRVCSDGEGSIESRSDIDLRIMKQLRHSHRPNFINTVNMEVRCMSIVDLSD